MEGLIPMVFKAIKRNKVRRQYRCLSVGTAQTYNIADFYDYGDHPHDHDHDHEHDHEHDHDQLGKFYTPPAETRGGGLEGRANGHRRRYSSAGEFGTHGGCNFNYDDHDEVINNGDGGYPMSPPKQIMKRYRSHRLFSCITGGI